MKRVIKVTVTRRIRLTPVKRRIVTVATRPVNATVPTIPPELR